MDGFSAENIGNLCLKGGDPPLAIPCTPAGVIELLQRSNVEVAGKEAVVLGRSNIVGMPLAQLLTSMNATVTVCHSRTKNLEAHVQRADIGTPAPLAQLFLVGHPSYGCSFSGCLAPHQKLTLTCENAAHTFNSLRRYRQNRVGAG